MKLPHRIVPLRTIASAGSNKLSFQVAKYGTSNRSQDTQPSNSNVENKQKDIKAKSGSTPKKKTQAELDEELRLKMSGLSGDGGESGVEYEDGQPVSMKRGVRENMFRYI